MPTIHPVHPLPTPLDGSPSASLPEAESPTAQFVRLLRFSIIMTALLAAASFPRSTFFRVSDVAVTGNRQIRAGELIAYSAIRSGDALLSLSAAQAAARVARHPMVAGARVTLLPGGQVLIQVAERRARAAVAHLNGYLIVDASGIVMDTGSDRAGLPALRVAGLSLPWVRLGDQLPAPQIRPALEVLALLPSSIQQSRFEIRMDAAEEFTIVTSDGVPVLLGPRRGLRERAAMLPEILAILHRQKIAVQYLDLRFTGNVVVRPAGPPSGEGVGP